MKKKKLIFILSLLIIFFLAFAVFTGIKYKSQIRPSKDKAEKSSEKMEKILSKEQIRETKKDSIVIALNQEAEELVEEKPDAVESPGEVKKKAEVQTLRKVTDMPAETTGAISIEKSSNKTGDKIEVLPVEKKKALPVKKEETVLAEKPPVKTQKGADVLPDVRVTDAPLAIPAPETVGKAVTVLEDKIEALPVEKEKALPVKKEETVLAEKPLAKTQKVADVIPVVRVTDAPLAIPAPEIAGKTVTGLEEKIDVISSTEEMTMPPAEVKTAVKKRPVKVVRNRVALLPFDNLTEDKTALRHVMPFLIGRLEERGLEVVDEDNLNSLLCKERVRETGYVSKEIARKIREEFGAETVLAGAIISFSTQETPKFGILARLIDSNDGRILWADFASATGDDFITILGLGKLQTVFSLIPRVTDMLFADFKIEGLQKKAEPSYKIAVMPFLNNSDRKNAGIIAMYMFIIELLKNQKFEPIEYGNIRDIIVSLRIRNKGELNFNNINALSEPLSANGILVGIVDSYENGLDNASAPRVAITARLLDGRTGKILWYNSHELSGEENIVILDWGRIRAVHKVAYDVVANLVKKMGAAFWN
ncbi:MAG: hypothetical protein HY757_02855 [Nitrospirae bacterium]|nr:hypothetical protein [Nitrospirota bacterium]